MGCGVGDPPNAKTIKKIKKSFTKRQVYKMSGLQNVRSSKRPVAKNVHIYSVLVVGGNPQVLLQPCLQAKGWPCFILYFRGFFAI